MASLPPQSAPAPPTPVVPLAALLHQSRQAQRLSLQAVAQRCTQLGARRVTPQYLSNLERGQRQPSLPLLHVLALVLALDPTALGAALLCSPPGPTPRASRRPAGAAAGGLLARVQRAAQQVTQAQATYQALLCAAHAAGVSLRQLAAVTGLSLRR